MLPERPHKHFPSDVITDLDAQIDQRTSYGQRSVEVTPSNRPAYKLMWANGSAKWYRAYGVYKTGTYQLDANEIMSFKWTQAQIDDVIEGLNPLPLYQASFESKQRGVYDKTVHRKAELERTTGHIRHERIE